MTQAMGRPESDLTGSADAVFPLLRLHVESEPGVAPLLLFCSSSAVVAELQRRLDGVLRDDARRLETLATESTSSLLGPILRILLQSEEERPSSIAGAIWLDLHRHGRDSAWRQARRTLLERLIEGEAQARRRRRRPLVIVLPEGEYEQASQVLGDRWPDRIVVATAAATADATEEAGEIPEQAGPAAAASSSAAEATADEWEPPQVRHWRVLLGQSPRAPVQVTAGLAAVDAACAAGSLRTALAVAQEVVDRARRQPRESAVEKRLLGAACDRLGDAALRLRLFDRARDAYREGLMLRQSLHAAAAGEETARELAGAWTRVGDLALQMGRFDDGHDAYLCALDLRRELLGAAPSTYNLHDLGVAWHRVGDACRKRGHAREAKRAYREAVELRQRLQAEAPAEQHARDLSVSWERLGEVALALDQIEAAERAVVECLNLRDELHRRLRSPRSARDLAVAWDRVGNVVRRLGRLDQAAHAYRRCVTLRRRLLRSVQRADAARDLALACDKVAEVALESGSLDEADESCRKALDLHTRLHRSLKLPRSALDLAAAWERTAEVARHMGRGDAARRAYAESLALHRKLQADLPSAQTAADLAAACDRLGDLERQFQHPEQARVAYLEGLALRRRLLGQTGDAAARRELAAALRQIGDLELDQGKIEAAEHCYREGLETLERLAKDAGESPELLAAVSDMLGRLGDVKRRLARSGPGQGPGDLDRPAAGVGATAVPHPATDRRERHRRLRAKRFDQPFTSLSKTTRMRYISTRGGMPPKTFCEILLGGLAPDGGLTLPERYPRVDAAELAQWRGYSYGELAFAILSKFADDIPAADLKAIVDRTYTAAVYCNARPGDDARQITPLRTLEPGLHLLQLSNGPTLAFKDMAMQLLGNLFEYVLDKAGQDLNILGATSGDTGSSAEYAMRGKHRIRVFMLSPHGKMSRFQTAQMFSLQDTNIFNIAVRGVFDDCQDIVKAVSNDLEFKTRYAIGTVNSINWARVAAQIVYYFKGYLAATDADRCAAGAPVSFAVPSGNFGNICAGHIARMMGLPIRRLILATNENDVLDEFFRSGVYRPRGTAETQQTSSPSMDISKASNFERFIFDLADRDAGKVRELWSAVDQGGAFDLSATPLFRRLADFGFVSGASSHADRIETIRRLRREHGITIDPHTADGVKVGLQHREAGVPLVCLETALPAKFEETIRKALGHEPERPAACADIETLPQRFEVMAADAAAVKRFIIDRVAA